MEGDEEGKVIGLSVSDVTFGDINVDRGEGPQAVLAAIAKLTEVAVSKEEK